MWIYNPETELYHYGVKGMKWGHRKRYITVAKGQRNARRAAEEARKKSVAESRASGDKGIGSFHRANRKALNAKRKAYRESIQKDREYNDQLRKEQRTDAAKQRIANAGGSKHKAALKRYGRSLANTALLNVGNIAVHEMTSDPRVAMGSTAAAQAAGVLNTVYTIRDIYDIYTN